jgi:hypothetical protein
MNGIKRKFNKKFFGIIFLLSSLTVQAPAQEIKFQNNKIYFLDTESPVYTEKIFGNVEEFPYRNTFYFQKENNKIIRILETFYFDNFGQFESRFRGVAKSIFLKPESIHGCNSSPKKIYHKAINNELRINCISIKILENKEDIFGPNFGSVQHLSLHLRKSKIKKFLKKNKLEIPKKMIRTEHYFYKSGKIIWIFMTRPTELDRNIELSIRNHQQFENDLKLGNFNKINFK